MKRAYYLPAAFAAVLALLCPIASDARGMDHGGTNYGNGIVSGSLPHGGRYVVTPQSSVPLTAVELWYAVPSTGFGPTPTTSIARVAAQAVAASAPVGATSLGDFIWSVGGTLSIDAFPGSVAVSALVPTPDVAQTVHIMTQSYFSGFVSESGLRRAKLDLVTESVLEQFDPSTVLRNALMSGLFVTGPAHYPTLDKQDLVHLALPAVKAFATEGFAESRASLVVSGAASANLLNTSVDSAAQATISPAQDARFLLSTVTKDPSTTSLPYLEPGSGFAWSGPDITDEQDATAMDFVADYLFHPTDGKVTHRITAEVPDVSLDGQFITFRKSGVFLVTLAGTGSDAAAKIARDELAALVHPLPSREFEQARNAFIYHLQSDLTTPAEFAASLGWYAVEGRPEYAPGANGAGGVYFSGAEALSPKQVANAVQKFLMGRPVAVTLQVPIQEKSH